MKLTKRISSLLLTFLVLFSLVGISASAATTTQDGLEVTLTTDKTEYTKNEQITATLKVENTSSETISNVTLETAVPDGYKLADDFVKTKKTDALNANESVELPVTYVPTSTSPDVVSGDSEKNTDNNKNGTGSSQIDNKTINNVSSNVSSVTSSGSTSSPKTGIISDYFIWFVLFAVAGVGMAAMIILKKKTAKCVLSFFLCLSIIGALTAQSVESVSAEELQTRSINVVEMVKVDKDDLTINALVKYDFISYEDENQSTDSEQTTDATELKADKYYQETSETILSTEYANRNNTLSEKEVYSLLANKNISQYPISYEYDLNGTYVGETEVNVNSDNKHPMYQTFYQAANGDLWNIFIVGKSVYASALSFNFESDTEIEYIFGEDDTLICYADSGNKYYFTIPKDTAVSYHVLEPLNANALDKLTFEEIDKL